MTELTKEKVIAVAKANTVELLEPYMREQDPDITQQRVDELMNLVTIRPDLMAHAKSVALDYYFNKFNVCCVYTPDGRIKKMY